MSCIHWKPSFISNVLTVSAPPAISLMERTWSVTSVPQVTQDPGVRGTSWHSNRQFHKAALAISKIQHQVYIFFSNIYKSSMLTDT